MDPNLFRKFGENLKKVLILAEKIARDSNREMDSTNLLLALVTTRGTLANDILTSFELSTDRVQVVAGLVSAENRNKSLGGMTQEAKDVIQKTIKIAADYHHYLVDTEHLLLALVSDKKFKSYQVIERTGIAPEKITEQLESIFNEINKVTDFARGDNFFEAPDFIDAQFDQNAENPFASPVATKTEEKSIMDEFTTDLTAEAKNNKLDPLIGRDSEITRICQILSRRTKNNPLLVGDPGVGKTAIVEGLAQKINSGAVPTQIIGKKLLSLDIGALIAGTMYRGQFEARVKKLLTEIKKENNVILFIDEIHATIGAGSAEGSIDIANLLKPMLSKGELRLIGATTFDEYRKHIEKDPAYERRFQLVKIDEPSSAETILILKGLRKNYEKHHNVKITDEAIIQAVELSKRYITDRNLPDKAIDLIDEAAAATNKVDKNSLALAKLKFKFSEIVADKDESVANENYEAATHLREEEIKLSDKIKDLEKVILDKKDSVITEVSIAAVVSKWSGIPVSELSESELLKFSKLDEKLKKNIVGQDNAIKKIVQAIKRNRAGISDPNKPIGSFLFLGPTGVGKTELAKQLTEELFGSHDALIRIDMSEFMERHSVSRLVGAPAGYIGYEDGGKLTEAVRRKPFSVILFDETEKAHPDFFNMLLQILDEGHLTDSRGRVVNFKNTIIIMTSNLGTRDFNSIKAIGFDKSNSISENLELIESHILETIKKELRPEFLNRLDDVVIFKPLDKKSIEKITSLELQKLAERIKTKKIYTKFDLAVKKQVADGGFSEEFGARPIKRYIAENIETLISENILSGKIKTGESITISYKNKFTLTHEK